MTNPIIGTCPDDSLTSFMVLYRSPDLPSNENHEITHYWAMDFEHAEEPLYLEVAGSEVVWVVETDDPDVAWKHYWESR